MDRPLRGLLKHTSLPFAIAPMSAGRTGFMTHAESEKSIRLFGNEVLPRMKEIAPVAAELEPATTR